MDKTTKRNRICAGIVSILMLIIGINCNWIKAKFYIFHMETDERIGTLNIDRTINTLAVKPGDLIADIGAGSGLFTFHFSEKTGPKGIVYAADINRSLLAHIKKSRDKNVIKNIITVLAAENDPKIPKQVDLIFLCDTLHYIDHQQDYVRCLSSYVKQGGRVAVIDFKRNWPPSSIKFSPEELMKWMANAGFILTGSHDFIRDEFFMIFQKK